MISLLLLPLLLLSSIQAQTCDMAGLEERMARMEERMEERVEERVEEVKVQMKEDMEAKLEEKETELKKELVAMEVKMEEKEAQLRQELASKEEMGRAVSQGLRDVPYLALCGYQSGWNSSSSTITYDSFLTDFNNGNKPGGADGQLDLGTGVFTCLTDAIYRIDYSGYAVLDPSEQVRVYVHLNGAQVIESRWNAYTSGTVGGQLEVTGSRSLMLPLKLGDTLELRTDVCTGELWRLVLCVELADQGLSTTP